MKSESMVSVVERPSQLLKRRSDGGIIIVEGNDIRERSAGQLMLDVDSIVDYLIKGGLGAGDRVGIRGPNSYEWLVLDLALISVGCISVCVPPEAAEFDSISVATLMDRLRLRVMFEATSSGGNVSSKCGIVDLSKILELTPPKMEIFGEKHPTTLTADDVFTVVFSSGSTGRLKRLPISWPSIQRHVEAFGKAFGLTTSDRILVVLPFSSFQQRYLVYCAIWHGCKVVLARPENFLSAMRCGRPTVVLGPPSFYEIVEQRFKLLPAWRRYGILGLAKAATVFPRKVRQYCGTLLFRPFHELYGGEVRVMLVGSAPVKRGTLELFRLGGFPLYQCYGMTEAGWIAWNSSRANKVGTVGLPAFPGTVRVADDGEVLISRAWNQCASYETFEDEAEETGVFLAQDTVATGDIGIFDADGYLILLGRKKNVIVTVGGLKVSPEEIEEKISALPTVRHAVVFDHPNMPSLAAAIWTREDNQDEKRVTVDAVRALNASALRRTPILGIVFPTVSLSAESGLLTRNLKIDRAGVRSKFQGTLLSLSSAADRA
jgi:long-chain acyl-CoA synthetase